MLHLKSAVRALLGSRGFSAIVIVTMAVGIAANTAMFSIYDRLVLNPVTIPDPYSLIAIWFNNPQRNTQSPSMSVPRFDGAAGETRSFSSIGLSAFDSFTLTGSGDADADHRAARQRFFLSDPRRGARARTELHRRGGPSQRSRRLHRQPRALADAIRRP